MEKPELNDADIVGVEETPLMDPIQRGEARCEGWADENVRGDEMTCFCGKTCNLDEAETLSADPYAIPVCPSCFEIAMDDKFGPSWRDKETQLSLLVRD